MTTLITILYAFLFSTPETIMPDCQGRLEELNYTYEYDKEPAVCQYAFCCRSFERCNNGVNEDTVQEIKSIYRCFSNLETNQNDKVILISYQSLLDTTQVIGSSKWKERLLQRRKRQVIGYYGLSKNNIYFKQDTSQIPVVKVQLLDKSNDYIQYLESQKIPVEIPSDCKNCPF